MWVIAASWIVPQTPIKKTMNSKSLLLMMLLLLTTLSGVKAQYVWHLSHGDADFRCAYCFTSISTYANNVSVTCSLADKLKRIYKNVIFRSTDGGEHWKLQDPGLDWRIITDAPLLVTIQQIDSLNIVAAGDSGMIIRSFDGGASWEKQDCKTISRITSVHFSDPMVGIATTYTFGLAKSIYTTTDGGRNWKAAYYILGSSLTQCYSYGGERFAVFQEGDGKIILTKDLWKTVTTITDFVDTTLYPDGKYYRFNNCNFTGGDTICVMGGDGGYGKIVRTVDGGKHWERPFTSVSSVIKISAMTPLDRDTVIAAAGSGDYYTYLSTDRGKTWRADTIILIDTSYPAVYCRGLCWVENKPIGIFGAPSESGNNIIVSGLSHASGVRVEPQSNIAGNIYPNPATVEVTILPPTGSQYITVFDVLGNRVFHERCRSDGGTTFDLRQLPRGFYNAYGEVNGRLLPIGKFVITGGH